MKIFTPMYDQTMRLSRHPQAHKYLCGLSFAESSFFPIPPDVMLMPMALAQPNKALYFAWLTTLFSVLGGIAGYAIGYWAMELLMPILIEWGYEAKILQAQEWFIEYGVWIVFAAGFSPIPYKLFTISAGASAMLFIPFVLASFIGRGARFFLVASLMKYGGARFEPQIRQWVDTLGWLVVALITVFVGYKIFLAT